MLLFSRVRADTEESGQSPDRKSCILGELGPFSRRLTKMTYCRLMNDKNCYKIVVWMTKCGWTNPWQYVFQYNDEWMGKNVLNERSPYTAWVVWTMNVTLAYPTTTPNGRSAAQRHYRTHQVSYLQYRWEYVHSYDEEHADLRRWSIDLCREERVNLPLYT